MQPFSSYTFYLDEQLSYILWETYMLVMAFDCALVSQVCWLGCFLCVGCFLSFFLTWSAAFNDSVLQVLDYRIFIGSKREELTKKSSEAASACMVQCFSRHAFKKVFKDKPVMINESWGILSSSAHTRMGYTKSVLMETIPNQTFLC